MRVLFVCLGISLAMMSLSAAPAPQRSANTNRFVEGEALVTFKPGAGLDRAKAVLHGRGAEMSRHFQTLSTSRGRHMALAKSSRPTVKLLADLAKDPDVEAAEPNYIYRLYGAHMPADPMSTNLWALNNTGQMINGSQGMSGNDIRFAEAWALVRPAINPPVVAVIDSGVYYNHPDLKPNMWMNPGEIPGNGIDDDQNGIIDDVHGVNFMNLTGDPVDSGIHGTHVAGTIAAVANNGIGIVGVCPGAKLMAFRVSDDGDTIAISGAISAMDYILRERAAGVNIVAINASWGGAQYSSTMESAIAAAGDAGIILCVAAGNEALDNDTVADYPGNYALPNIISVAATDQQDGLASFSNYGAANVDLAAPGVNIFSVRPPATNFFVQTPGTNYAAQLFEFATLTSDLSGKVVDCGLGQPAEFPAAVQGQIALMSRGDLFFSEKVANAMAAGARGAVIYNNVAGEFGGNLQYENSWIPTVSISREDGLALKARLPLQASLISRPGATEAYQYLDGTSMASPHVAGAIAFAAINFPDDTVDQRVQRILSAVDYIPSLAGRVVTGGRLNLLRIVDSDLNDLPDWWEQKVFGQPMGDVANQDPDQDGLTTRQEYLADTDPLDPDSALKLTLQAVVGQGRVLGWSAGKESVLTLERTTIPNVESSWVPVLTLQPPHDLQTAFADTAATNTQAFYRLRAERPSW